MMPRTNVTLIRVMLSCPSDVSEEKSIAQQVIQSLNNDYISRSNMRFELISSELSTFPDIGSDVQSIINTQIADDYDLYVGVFWARFGTPTPRSHSGTEEEFERAYERFKDNPDSVRVLFYFKTSPIQPSEIDADQLAQVNQFKSTLGSKGVYWWEFESADDFEKLLLAHLFKHAERFQVDPPDRGDEQNDSIAHINSPQDEQPCVDEGNSGVIEDIGLLDLIEVVHEKFQEAGHALSEITQTITDTVEITDQASDEIDLNRSSISDIDAIKNMKRIVNKVASSLERVGKTINANGGNVTQPLNEGIEAMSAAAVITRTFNADNQSELDSAAVQFEDLAVSMSESRVKYRRI